MAMMLPPSVISGAALARQRHQRIGAHVMGDAERLTAGVDEFAFQRLFRRESHGMEQQVQFAELLADFGKTRAISSSLVTSHGIRRVSAPKVPASSSTFSLSRSPW